jgi:tetratricopeptide (TPR) repeat protein
MRMRLARSGVWFTGWYVTLAVVVEKSVNHNKISGTVTGAVVQAHTIQGGVHVHPPGREVVIPRQLPASPGSRFVGRIGDLAALGSVLGDGAKQSGTVAISAVGGMGGIGKTWLALQWAYQHLDRFPDGQLFVDLRGFSPSGEPMAPAVAIRGFLDALGVAPSMLPVDLDAQVGLYRSLVAGRRMLLVLDNAYDTSQVTALLPGSPACTVIVTSRNHLAGLVTAHGASPLAVDVLDGPDARALLAVHLDDRALAAEPDAVTALLDWCAGLPLALSVVASRAAAHPWIPLGALTSELRDTSTRLDAMDEGDPATSLQTVLSWSYAALPPVQATVFGLVGLAIGQDISKPAVVSLTALPEGEVPAALRALERMSLIQQHAPGRYRMHDLIRLYACQQARRDQPLDGREAAEKRLLDFYLHTAQAGDQLLAPHRVRIELDRPVPGVHPLPLTDEAHALVWFDVEHTAMLAILRLAIQRDWHRAVWQLAWVLTVFHLRRGHVHDQLAVWQAGAVAAESLGDPIARARAYRLLGAGCAQVGRHAEAVDNLQQALVLAERAGDLLGQANSYHALANAWAQQGNDMKAVEHATHALRLFQALDTPIWEATALNAVGWLDAQLGQHDQARTHCDTALALFRRFHNREGEANTLDSLGYIAHLIGHHDQALQRYQQAVVLYRDLGNDHHLANTLDRLGHTHMDLGHDDEARDTWRQALELYQAQHRYADVDRVQQRLAELASEL